MKTGRYVKQPGGYRAFIPEHLPPVPPLKYDEEMTRLLSDADRALGRLDGVASVLPNPDLFVAMYVRHEAVLSSQIEGTQSTLEDLVNFELEGATADRPTDLAEVVNYVAAMNYGIGRLTTLPLSKRLLCEIHKRLLKGVRGAERQPALFANRKIGSVLLDAHSIVPISCHHRHMKWKRHSTTSRRFYMTKNHCLFLFNVH